MPCLDGETKLVAVLGHPIAHTASPVMHNAAFAALRLNWKYVALDVQPKDLRKALQGLAASGVVGVNLTVPHKVLAMRLVDRLHVSARRLGAANTLRLSRGGVMEGFNTDGEGLLAALREEFAFSPKERCIAVMGCGGAGRAAAMQLALAGAKRLVLINRTPSKARAVARDIRRLGCKTTCGLTAEPCDLVIQATSLGLKPSDANPVSKTLLRTLRPRYFFDMIYRPARTRAMKLAAGEGIRVANGMEMLLHQGARAWEIWTERKAPVGVMRRALMRELQGRGR